MHGVYVSNCGCPRRPPSGCCSRDGEPVAVTPSVRLQSGDQLLVVAPEQGRARDRTAVAGGGQGRRAGRLVRRAGQSEGRWVGDRQTPPDPASPRGAARVRARGASLLVVLSDLVSKIIIVATGRAERAGPAARRAGVPLADPQPGCRVLAGHRDDLAAGAGRDRVVVVIIRMAPRLRSTPWAVSLGLVLGGALGNLIDRIFRAPGLPAGPCRGLRLGLRPERGVLPGVQRGRLGRSPSAGSASSLTALLGIDFDGTRSASTRRRAHEAPWAGLTVGTRAGCPVPDGLAGMRVDAGLARCSGCRRTSGRER